MLESAFPSFYISNIFWGECPHTPLAERGRNGPFISHSRLFHRGKPLTSKINETPVKLPRKNKKFIIWNKTQNNNDQSS